MLAAQKKHIKNNYVEVIKNTRCSVTLLSALSQVDLLSEEDVENLSLQASPPLERSKRLYEILKTRADSYTKLINALQADCQTGAVQILQKIDTKFIGYGLISVNKSHYLGRGHSGRVFKGKFEDRKIAVKVVPVESDQAIKEVELLKALDHHENIVRYFFAEQYGNEVYIALELCLVSLEDNVDIKLVTIEPLTTVSKCTNGVAFLHENKIIHRDLKPSNVLLTSNGQIKISDFGFSKHVNNDSSMATTSGVYGTLDWMAPELLEMAYSKQGMETSKISYKIDIFALGCVYFFALTNGEHPFGLPGHRTSRILSDNHDIQSSNLQDHLKSVILMMLSWMPDKRPNAEYLLNLSKSWISGIQISNLSAQLKHQEAIGDTEHSPHTANSESKPHLAHQTVEEKSHSEIERETKQQTRIEPSLKMLGTSAISIGTLQLPIPTRIGMLLGPIIHQITGPSYVPKSNTDVMFDSVICDECKRRPLIDRRYKCVQCLDYDLCWACMILEHHSRHIFVVMKSRQQQTYFQDHWLNAVSLSQTEWGQRVEYNFRKDCKCSNCDNLPKYICLCCSHLVGFCYPCFECIPHDVKHVFAVADTDRKLELILTILVVKQFDFEKVVSKLLAIGMAEDNE